MKTILQVVMLGGALGLFGQNFDDGPGGGAPPGPRGPGGFGGMQQQTKLLKQFDKDGNDRLDAAERKAAREYLQKELASRGRRGPGPFNRRNESQEPPQPGAKISPDQVKLFPDAPLYASNVVRTLFLKFEDADWEKELADFNNTDVEVPAQLTADGKTYADIGVHFRGMSSFMMVSEGHKRSLNLSLDFVHAKQNIGGYRTLNLLNSHEDPTFLRTVLYDQIAREFVPAPKANFVRVVINGEDWGVYVNAQQFNKDFVKERFGTTKGARWKVPGSPRGQGSLKYLGDDAAKYKGIYQIKTKDDPKSWADLIRLCKVLNETPADKLEAALTPLLDIDGALKFLALENVFINNDGYWVRTSDYNIYEDTKGRFHIIPHDTNETFSKPGGPGFGGPGAMFAPQIFLQADKNADGKLTRDEFAAFASAWFDKLDSDKSGKVTPEKFTQRAGDLLMPPRDRAPEGETQRPRDAFRPEEFIGRDLFAALDANTDGTLTRSELAEVFSKWFTKWDSAKAGALTEETFRNGFSEVLPNGPARNGGRGRGGRGGGGGIKVDGVKLDPLVAANDAEKPLLSKLLAVPTLRTRYLSYVHDMADKWLDWKNLGPLAEQYHSLIATEVKADTRKLDSTEDFARSLTEDIAGKGGPGGGGSIGLKNFAEQRRAFLLNYSDSNKPARP